MAEVSDFLNKQKVARNAAETAQRQVRMAYDAAQAGTRQPTDKYDRLDLLEGEHTRIAFKNTLIDKLTEPYATAIGGMPDDPEIAQALVLNGALGFGPTEARGIVDAMKDKISHDGFMKILDEKTGWQKALETRINVPVTVLDQVSAAKVANYAGIVAKNPDKMTLQDKAELITTFDKLGVIPLKKFKDKAYM